MKLSYTKSQCIKVSIVYSDYLWLSTVPGRGLSCHLLPGSFKERNAKGWDWNLLHAKQTFYHWTMPLYCFDMKNTKFVNVKKCLLSPVINNHWAHSIKQILFLFGVYLCVCMYMCMHAWKSWQLLTTPNGAPLRAFREVAWNSLPLSPCPGIPWTNPGAWYTGD